MFSSSVIRTKLWTIRHLDISLFWKDPFLREGAANSKKYHLCSASDTTNLFKYGKTGDSPERAGTSVIGSHFSSNPVLSVWIFENFFPCRLTSCNLSKICYCMPVKTQKQARLLILFKLSVQLLFSLQNRKDQKNSTINSLNVARHDASLMSLI